MSSAPSKVCLCVCGFTGASVCVGEGRGVSRWAWVFVFPRTFAHLKHLCLCVVLFMCGFICPHSFLYVSVWDESMTCSSSFNFFPPDGSLHPSVCVPERTVHPIWLPAISVSVFPDLCGIFQNYFYIYLHDSCSLRFRINLCVSVAMCLGLKRSLWSWCWQPTAPRRDPPAGWNMG